MDQLEVGAFRGDLSPLAAADWTDWDEDEDEVTSRNRMQSASIAGLGAEPQDDGAELDADSMADTGAVGELPSMDIDGPGAAGNAAADTSWKGRAKEAWSHGYVSTGAHHSGTKVTKDAALDTVGAATGLNSVKGSAEALKHLEKHDRFNGDATLQPGSATTFAGLGLAANVGMLGAAGYAAHSAYKEGDKTKGVQAGLGLVSAATTMGGTIAALSHATASQIAPLGVVGSALETAKNVHQAYDARGRQQDAAAMRDDLRSGAVPVPKLVAEASGGPAPSLEPLHEVPAEQAARPLPAAHDKVEDPAAGPQAMREAMAGRGDPASAPVEIPANVVAGYRERRAAEVAAARDERLRRSYVARGADQVSAVAGKQFNRAVVNGSANALITAGKATTVATGATGAGAAAGVGLELAGNGVKGGSAIMRLAKQAYRNFGFGNQSKTSAAKAHSVMVTVSTLRQLVGTEEGGRMMRNLGFSEKEVTQYVTDRKVPEVGKLVDALKRR